MIDEYIYRTGDLSVSFGVDRIEGLDADSKGFVSSVFISEEESGKILFKLTKQEWDRLCLMTSLDRDKNVREAYFAQQKAWRELQEAIEATAEKIRKEIWKLAEAE